MSTSNEVGIGGAIRGAVAQAIGKIHGRAHRLARNVARVVAHVMPRVMAHVVAPALALGILATGPVFAQAYPTKPIRIIVPYPVGGTTDLVARSVAPLLSESLGQPVVIENKSGAGGTIGEAEVARAAPDGYTLALVFDNHGVNHHLYKRLPYDPFKAFDAVSLMVQSPHLLAAPASFPASNLKELIDYAKANNGKVVYGSTGTGSSNHLAPVLLARRGGFEAVHVPYKGGGPLLNDLLGGQVGFAFGSLPFLAPQVKSGKLKAIAVAGRARSPQFPDVPTVAETFPGFEAQSWIGLLAPAGTPRAVIDRLSAELARLLKRPEMNERLVGQGFIVVGSSPEQFDAYIRAESDKWGKLIREMNITLE